MNNREREIQVNKIADDDTELVKMVKHLASIGQDEDVILDPKWKDGSNFQTPVSSACAILIQKKSAPGAVRVYSDPVTNVETGPNQDPEVVLVIVNSDEGCRLFGTPSVRWFCRRT